MDQRMRALVSKSLRYSNTKSLVLGKCHTQIRFNPIRFNSSNARSEVHPTSLNAFNANHSLYDQYRPTFYGPAITDLLGRLKLSKGAKVIDLAAGTGKFTEVLAGRGFDLSAVEISDGMLSTFRKKHSSIPAYKGSSYDIPFESSSLDAIFCAQAFHWFADIESLREMHRVLKPEVGKLALVWNFEPEMEHNSKWQRRIAELCWGFDLNLPQFRRQTWQNVWMTDEADKLFYTPMMGTKMYWSYKISPESIWPLWETRSYITELPEEDKTSVRLEIERILREEASDFKDSNGLLDLKMGVFYSWVTART
ncbi:S-adenosyl-L-methionine-dependent methyltransferase [Dipodascopsis uninucleata]